MTEGLKPCPFCGGRAVIREVETRTYRIGGYYVMCGNCLTSGNNYKTKQKAADAWNRRYHDDDAD